jgi:hypothetical protein
VSRLPEAVALGVAAGFLGNTGVAPHPLVLAGSVRDATTRALVAAAAARPPPKPGCARPEGTPLGVRRDQGAMM